MRELILAHNPFDYASIAFKNHLDSLGVKYCLLDWYSHQADPARAQETALRLLQMHLDLSIIGLSPIPDEIEYTDEDIESGVYPEENLRWIMQCCDKHKGEGYYGPPLRSMPSIIEKVGEEWVLWDSPSSFEACKSENISWKCKEGECLAGQWIESAKVCALSPHWSNHLIRESVTRYVKRFETITLPQNDRILVERQTPKKRELSIDV